MAGEPERKTRIPAHYALKAALRDIRSAWTADSENWVAGMAEQLRKGRLTGDSAAAILERLDSRLTISLDRRDRRRLGRTEPVFDMVRMQNVDIRPRHSPDGPERRELVMMMRDVITLRQNEIDVRTDGVGIALDRHAAERLYEREKCTPAEIIVRLRDDMGRLMRAISYARAARIVKRPRDSGPNAPLLARGNMTFVPMGSGAIIVEATQIDVRGVTARRSLVRRSGSAMTVASHDPEMQVQTPTAPIGGERTSGVIVMTGVTYLSADMLRQDQRDYLDMFDHEMEQVDADALASRLGTVTMPHETRAPWPEVEPPPETMMKLLRQNVRRNKDAWAWTTVRDDD